MNKNRSGYRFLGGWRGLRELLPNNLGAFTQVFASLKSYNFRLYFGGQCISLIGTWMQQIAMSWLVFRLTGSVLLLATVTFMAQIPILVATPYMSVFVDRFNRCKFVGTDTITVYGTGVVDGLAHVDRVDTGVAYHDSEFVDRFD